MISDAPRVRVEPKPLPKVRIGALAALAAALAFTAWLLVHHFSAGTTAVPPGPVTTTPRRAVTPAATQSATTSLAAVTSDQLTSTAASLGHSIFWAGPSTGMTYELKLTADGSASVRYLPAGVAVGDPRPYLQIATWALPHAYAATARAAAKPGAVKLDAGPNAVAFYDQDRPIDVWEAFKGSDYQIEVFAPSAQQAQQIVTGGEIQDASTAAGAATHGPVAATKQQLAHAAAILGHPLYWLGTRRGTYELTQTPNGRTYVRYLPAGADVGTAVAYLTVGTYPLENAYGVTKSAASQPNTTSIRLKNGIAFYSNARPNSIYVAFQGVDQQVELYDPAPTKARAAAEARKVVPVP